MISPSNPHARDVRDSGGMHCIPTKFLRREFGLSRVQISLLAYVIDNPVTQGSRKAIADECGCAANSIPRAARKLKELGLLEVTTPPGLPSMYALGDALLAEQARNAEVTGNMDVTTTRNTEVTPQDVVAAQPKRNTRASRNTEVTGVVTSPPRPPYKNITPLEDNFQTPELEFERGPGRDLLGDDPAPKKRKPKRVATEASMPKEPTSKMLAHAGEKGFFNGTAQGMFEKWRNHHIAKGTEIADHEASWRMWVGNSIEFAKRDSAKANPSFKGRKPDGYTEDGKPYFNRTRTHYS